MTTGVTLGKCLCPLAVQVRRYPPWLDWTGDPHIPQKAVALAQSMSVLASARSPHSRGSRNLRVSLNVSRDCSGANSWAWSPSSPSANHISSPSVLRKMGEPCGPDFW